MEKLLTPDEVCELFKVKRSTLYKWSHMGMVPHVKVGNLLRFRESDLMKWIEKRTRKGRTDRLPRRVE